MITVESLHIYPVKSCRGISLESAEVVSTGFRWDRCWMVAAVDGSFLSQRSHPAMATVTTRITDDRLVIGAPGRPDLGVGLANPPGGTGPVTVWKDTCPAVSEGSLAAGWFSELLGTPCELVRQVGERPVDARYAAPGDSVSFADGFPFLLVSHGSVDELNRRLEVPVRADRFRANLVVDGCPPHAEDGWKSIRIGSISFRVVKPCARCVIVNTGQRDGDRTDQPLKTLAEYRTIGSNVLFGQNLVHTSTGILGVGDEVEVIEGA